MCQKKTYRWLYSTAEEVGGVDAELGFDAESGNEICISSG